jgi:nitrite reductase/ring-hydroxylating ferredoxin subunit
VGDSPDRSWEPGFNEWLLGGIAALIGFGACLAVVLYLLPGDRLRLSELQPAYRVAPESAIPVGSSRIVNWGDRVILVIRTGQQAYAALQGTAPNDGCILEWDPSSLRVLSPCTYLVYDLHGNVVRGLTTIPLRNYQVYVHDGVIYVARS